MFIFAATEVLVSGHDHLDGHLDDHVSSREDDYLDDHLPSRKDDRLDGHPNDHVSSREDDHLDIHLDDHLSSRAGKTEPALLGRGSFFGGRSLGRRRGACSRSRFAVALKGPFAPYPRFLTARRRL